MLYNDYTNRIKNIVAKNQLRKSNDFTGRTIGAIGGITQNKHRLHEQKAFSDEMHFNQTDLMSLVAGTSLEQSRLGVHPDFAYLKGTDETENHWIISVFVDIQGSTNLFRDYDLEEIYSITNTIQAAVIHTIVALGGQIQRLQGDGVLAYFGGKIIDKKEAVRMSLIACSFISYFVKNDLKDLFLKDGIEEISTRIGVDFGDDPDVMWANFGVEHISELTTLSLHTSLAAKMQANAARNGIVTGDFVKDRMPEEEIYFKIISENERYIFTDKTKGFRYTQWVFEWERFLKNNPLLFQTVTEVFPSENRGLELL